MGIPLGIGGVVILLVGSWLTGVNLFDVVGGGGATDVVAERPASSSPEEERLVDFVDAVMGDIQQTWTQALPSYQPTRATLFRDSFQSACGLSSSATGPFYCPGDRKVYLDLGFFDDLHQKLGAPGDFALAYVLARVLHARDVGAACLVVQAGHGVRRPARLRHLCRSMMKRKIRRLGVLLINVS